MHARQAPASRGVAVIAHPHPLFGGTMNNKVVQTLARAFVQCGWSAVRFNFRGVGASAGAHDHGVGEAADLLAVVEQVAPSGVPLALAGFSFGAFVTSHAVATLWAQRPMDKIVLVGTAASRFEVAPLPPEAHDRTLVVHGEAGRHRAAGRGHGLGAAADAACHGDSWGRALLSRTIDPFEASGGPPPARLTSIDPPAAAPASVCGRSVPNSTPRS